MQSNISDSEILNYMKAHHQNMLDDLEQFVKKESPSHNKKLVDECGVFIEELIQSRLGISSEVIPQSEVGDCRKFTFGQGSEQILVVAHLDTVWEQGRLSFRIEGNKAYGPGIFDMKGSIIQSIWALKAIKDSGTPLDKKIVLLLTSDEEIGSPYCRSLIEEEAKKSQVVLVPEPPVVSTGALKTSRKGTARFKVIVRGQAAHAGNHHEDGVNAIEELSRQVIRLQNLTDYSKGITVNVGVMQGGSRTNVVPDYAEADVELRATTMEEMDRVAAIIAGLQPHSEGARLEVTGGITRPPMARSDKTGELFQLAQVAATKVGLELTEAAVGGGSDGNFSAALGIPTLDGLGSEGEGAHAPHEHVLIDAIPQRAAFFTHFLLQL